VSAAETIAFLLKTAISPSLPGGSSSGTTRFPQCQRSRTAAGDGARRRVEDQHVRVGEAAGNREVRCGSTSPSASREQAKLTISTGYGWDAHPSNGTG